MSELVLRPRSATELIDATFQVYRRAPAPFIIAVALIYVPWFVLWLFIATSMGLMAGTTPAPGQIPTAFFLILPITMVASTLLYALLGGVTAVLTRAVYLEEGTDVSGAFGITFRHLINLMVGAFISFVLIMIGFIFLIIPGIYLALRFFAVPQAIVLEDVGPVTALTRSGDLSRGRKWHIFATFFLIVLLSTVIDGGAAIVFNLLGSSILASVLLLVVATVLVPLFGITQTLLYFDSRIRNEGFDVEYLAGGPTPSAPSGLAT